MLAGENVIPAVLFPPQTLHKKVNKTTAAGFKFCPSGETGSEAAAAVPTRRPGAVSYSEGIHTLTVAGFSSWLTTLACRARQVLISQRAA